MHTVSAVDALWFVQSGSCVPGTCVVRTNSLIHRTTVRIRKTNFFRQRLRTSKYPLSEEPPHRPASRTRFSKKNLARISRMPTTIQRIDDRISQTRNVLFATGGSRSSAWYKLNGRCGDSHRYENIGLAASFPRGLIHRDLDIAIFESREHFLPARMYFPSF